MSDAVHSNPTSRAARSVDPTDLARFERLGREWWDERGSMAQLHKINPIRIAFIRDNLVRHFGRTVGGDGPSAGLPLAGLRVLDIGCGGGLLSEPLTRLGAKVTGLDPGDTNIGVARAHAAALGLEIDYRAGTLEDLADKKPRFDVVIASEVIEHVVDPQLFTDLACSLVGPGGMIVASTLNRTAKSFLLAIVGAEYVLGWLPRGTHDWRKFIRPGELDDWVRRAGFRRTDLRGMIFDPLNSGWRLGRDTDVNYLFAAARIRPAT